MYDLSILGARIRQLRTKKGFTQDSFARELGVSAQAVSKWETGAGCPDISMLPLIANLLETSIDSLFSYTDPEPKQEIMETPESTEEVSAALEDEVQDNVQLVYTWKGHACYSDMQPISFEQGIVRFPNGGFADLRDQITVHHGNGSGTIYCIEAEPPKLTTEMETDALDIELDRLSAEIDAEMKNAETEFGASTGEHDTHSYQFDRESYRAAHGEENARVQFERDSHAETQSADEAPPFDTQDSLGQNIAREVRRILNSGNLKDLDHLGSFISQQVDRTVQKATQQAEKAVHKLEHLEVDPEPIVRQVEKMEHKMEEAARKFEKQGFDPGFSGRYSRSAGERSWSGSDIQSLFLQMSGNADITVESGSQGAWSVEAEGSIEFLEHLSCIEDGDTLRVEVTPYQQRNRGFFSRKNSITIYTGFTEGEELEAELQGSGDLDCAPNFRVSRVSIHGSGDIELSDAGYLTAGTSGSGDITVARARNAVISSSGSGDVEIGELEGVSEMKTSGSCDVVIGTAVGSLSFRSSGSCDFELGSAALERLTISTSGSGDVTIDGGTAEVLDLTLRGSGDFSGEDLTVGNLVAVLSGASDATIGRVTGQISEHISRTASLEIGKRG